MTHGIRYHRVVHRCDTGNEEGSPGVLSQLADGTGNDA